MGISYEISDIWFLKCTETSWMSKISVASTQETEESYLSFSYFQLNRHLFFVVSNDLKIKLYACNHVAMIKSTRNRYTKLFASADILPKLRYWLVPSNVENNRINQLNEKRSLIPLGLRACPHGSGGPQRGEVPHPPVVKKYLCSHAAPGTRGEVQNAVTWSLSTHLKNYRLFWWSCFSL